MQRIMGLLVLLAIPTVLLADGDELRKELAALAGNWKAIGLEVAGQAYPKDAIPEFTFEIGADGKCFGKTPQSEYSAKLTVDPGKDPKTMDNLHESGAQKGKKQFGVYKLEGNKLTVCMTPPGRAESDRPKDFNTKKGTNVLFLFERAKESKKP